MVKLKVVPYVFKIREKRGKLINLEGLNMPKLFENFITEGYTVIDKKKGKVFSTGRILYDQENDLYYGSFSAGDFGYTSKIIDTKSNKKVLDKRPEYAEIIKFYYAIKFEKNHFLILLSQFKKRGIKTLFLEKFKEFLIKNSSINETTHSLSLNPVYSTKFHDEIKELVKIKFIRHRRRRDVESNIIKELYGELKIEELVEERTLRPPKGIKSCKKLKGLLSNYKYSKYLELDGEEYEDLKMVVKMNDGCSKTIKMSKEFKLQESYEITFKGDLPSLNEFYNQIKDYFLYVINNFNVED